MDYHYGQTKIGSFRINACGKGAKYLYNVVSESLSEKEIEFTKKQEMHVDGRCIFYCVNSDSEIETIVTDMLSQKFPDPPPVAKSPVTKSLVTELPIAKPPVTKSLVTELPIAKPPVKESPLWEERLERESLWIRSQIERLSYVVSIEQDPKKRKALEQEKKDIMCKRIKMP